MGITIQTQRANGTSRQRYSLIDRTTGTVLQRDVDGLIDLEARLLGIIWDRQRARADGPPIAVAPSSCPSCGTRRIGQFRWCRSCGRDFEPTLHLGPRWPAFRLEEPDATAKPTEPTEWARLPPPVPIVVRHPGVDPAPRRQRLRLFRLPVRERDSFLSVREIGIGALLGLLIGVITADPAEHAVTQAARFGRQADVSRPGCWLSTAGYLSLRCP